MLSNSSQGAVEELSAHALCPAVDVDSGHRHRHRHHHGRHHHVEAELGLPETIHKLLVANKAHLGPVIHRRYIMEPTKEAEVHAAVSEYYGETLKGTTDLKTSACVVGGELTGDVAKLLRNVHPEVQDRFYGCGSPIAPLLQGVTTLDLGCGTGRDVYVASQLIGPTGTAIGVDMTSELLEIAQRHESWHSRKFGFTKPNTRFVKGTIENLKAAEIEDNSVDVVMSNCVLNLASDKEAVFREIWRVLKPGGELYFSDVFSDRRVPIHLQKDKVLWGECLSGALYRGDFARIMRRVGFTHYWTVTSRRIDIEDPAIKAMLGPITFLSETIRAFKVVPTSASSANGSASVGASQTTVLEDSSEDYGHTATYRGTLAGFPHAFSLGMGQTFITDQATHIDGNTALVLSQSRYARAFKLSTGKDHRGPFGGAGMGGAYGVAVQPSSCTGSNGESAAPACCASSLAHHGEASRFVTSQ